MYRMKVYYYLLFFIILTACASLKEQPDVNENKIDLILKTMSLEEKVGQTCQITLEVVLKRDESGAPISPATIDQDLLNEAIGKYKVGSILNVGYHTLSLSEWKHIITAVNKPFVDGLEKAPVIYGIDAIHGMNYTKGATLFPQEIGLAATWNRDLARRFAEITAYETRASGIRWNFSPVLDLGRQPLWSRNFETLGEDPYLAAELGAELIKGYQGDSIGANQVAACMKHFVGYSNPMSGRDRTPAWIPEKYLTDLYFPPFKRAVDEGALTVMINSGVLNGVPGHANYQLLTEKLKKEWGFKGFAVSDWEDFIMLHTVHRVSESLEDAYIKAFNAGVDMSMVPLAPFYKDYCNIIIAAVKNGKISQERLDDAVRRILRVKHLTGLFDDVEFRADDYPDFGSEKFRQASLDAALESITLLKNENNTLPLTKNTKVLVAGPTANNLVFLNGAWTHTWQGSDTNFNTKGAKTVFQAFKSHFGAQNCLYAQGAELFVENGFENTRLVDVEDYISKLDKVDVVVLCLGEMPSTEKPGDIRSLNLDKEQMSLARLAYEKNKKVILVLLEGRPRIIRDIVDQSAAIVQCYLPGDYGADALVKLVTGDANFSGRLPYTYQKYDGIIEFYDHPRSVDRSKSGDFSAYDPQWDFGFGLSYSLVDYSDLKIDQSNLKGNNSLTVSVKIRNNSDRAVKEVVQLYLADEYASVIPEGKKLKGFQKINLLPNSETIVNFTISKTELMFSDEKGKFILEEGDFTIFISKLATKFNYSYE
jgi:beta-glucosidase